MKGLLAHADDTVLTNQNQTLWSACLFKFLVWALIHFLLQSLYFAILRWKKIWKCITEVPAE